MASVEALPRWMGVFLLIIGVVFLIPTLAIIHLYLTPDLWDMVVEELGWSYFMIGWVIGSFIIIAIAFAYGSEIIWYSDSKANVKSIEEKAEASEFKPVEENDDKTRN